MNETSSIPAQLDRITSRIQAFTSSRYSLDELRRDLARELSIKQPQNVTDADAVNAAKGLAVAACVNRITPRIRHYAGFACNLDDLRQNLMVKLLEHPNLNVTDAYAVTMARNLATDHTRSAARRRVRETDATMGRMSSADSGDPLAVVMRIERRTLLKHAIRSAGIPANHRCALWARLRDRLPEFAARENISPSTCRTWVKRAMDKLKHCVAKDPTLSKGLASCWELS